MSQSQKANFDIEIAPVEDRERMIDRQNAEAMKRLRGAIPGAKPQPLKERRRR
jgi:hypothetical protein